MSANHGQQVEDLNRALREKDEEIERLREALGQTTRVKDALSADVAREGNRALAAEAKVALVEAQNDTLTKIVEYALHLRMYGERAPGGNETWSEWDSMAEGALRAALADAPAERPHPKCHDDRCAGMPPCLSCDEQGNGPWVADAPAEQGIDTQTSEERPDGSSACHCRGRSGVHSWEPGGHCPRNAPVDAPTEQRTETFTGLVLRSDLLGVWSGWLTPVFEPRRYRTWFFVAAMPEGQRTRDVSTESSSVTWLPAIGAVEAVEAAEMLMLPPTYLTCLEIAQHDTPQHVLEAAADRRVEMFTPQVVGEGEDAKLTMPEGMLPLVESRRG